MEAVAQLEPPLTEIMKFKKIVRIYLLICLTNLKFTEERKCVFYLKYLFCRPFDSAAPDGRITRPNVATPLHRRVGERVKRKETRKSVRKKQTEKARKAARKNSEKE